jgi:hypothetical protein
MESLVTVVVEAALPLPLPLPSQASALMKTCASSVKWLVVVEGVGVVMAACYRLMAALAAVIEIRWMLLPHVAETMVAAVTVPFVEAVIRQHATAEGRVVRGLHTLSWQSECFLLGPFSPLIGFSIFGRA